MVRIQGVVKLPGPFPPAASVALGALRRGSAPNEGHRLWQRCQDCQADGAHKGSEMLRHKPRIHIHLVFPTSHLEAFGQEQQQPQGLILPPTPTPPPRETCPLAPSPSTSARGAGRAAASKKLIPILPRAHRGLRHQRKINRAEFRA